MADARIDDLKRLLPQCMLADWVRLGSRLVRLLKDQHHPGKHDAVLDRLVEEARASFMLRQERGKNVPRISYASDLPITARKDEIVAAIHNHQVVVIAGETGSGKTTQLPKMCLEAGLGIEAKIGCTQPRRVAALSISRRIAEEINSTWGKEVGCKIRFDDRSSRETYIKMMTDGILLAETQADPTLAEYNAIIIDEAHERSLNIDFLLGYLKGLLARRNDLKLIVSSATIDTELFSRHFNNAPIIEVSGRLYPVEVVYEPLDAGREERGEIAYVDAAVEASERIVNAGNAGDLLIFMPGERDIRETADQLEGRFSSETEIIPLFGRLSSGDQQRVFAPSLRRKIVIATNIAETSLTIPGIRYVIDSGLARLSRYNPRTRIKRLPVEPISQSSANQRKGRAGRIEAGICIRLFAEEDFLARPAFTQPEIQRANLAEVILRMKAFGLGGIETFPFIQPPAPAAITSGYTLLHELGALNETRELTMLGRDLARLPIDPTLGRMLLQAQHEHATHELLIIAAGLSIQDPRERPMDQKEAAAAAHKKFDDPRSDFLALLNVWNAVHDQWENLRTQNQRRRFCKQHFLSYVRMREWQDLYAQLHDALEDLGTLKLNESSAAYPAIHRSILAGLVAHVARREERNLYKGTTNKQLTLFPGSVFYEKGEPPKKRFNKAPRSAPEEARSNQPQWIVAGEIVETSQLFARTVAGIEPQWIFDLAPHLCKLTHQNPHWSASSGRVLADEIVTLHGLEISRREMAYGNINAKEATEIFIRSALVAASLFAENESPDAKEPERQNLRHLNSFSSVTSEDQRARSTRYKFVEHNRTARQKIENWQTRVRRYDLRDADQALFQFYARRIENVSSLHELNRLLAAHPEPDFLCISEEELAGGQALTYDAEAFPDAVAISGQPVAVSYAYSPGEEHDGATFRIPIALAQTVSPALLEWAVPGLREEKVSELLRALPKSIRRELMPFPPKVAEIVRDFHPTGPSLLHDLATFLRQRYGVEVKATDWPAEILPAHLRARVEIVSGENKTLAAGRSLENLRRQVEKVKVDSSNESGLWKNAAEKWERFGLTSWSFGDMPERLTVTETPFAIFAWPGLEVEEGSVNLRLFQTGELARRASIPAAQRLIEIAVQKELAWLEKDLRALSKLESLYAPLGTLEDMRETALENLKNYILSIGSKQILTALEFQNAVENARKRIPGIAQQLIDRLTVILQLHQQIRQRLGVQPAPPNPNAKKTFTDFKQLGEKPPTKSAQPWTQELETLLSPRFLEKIHFERLSHIPRYLKALLMRIERAAVNPAKDQERARQIAPYRELLPRLKGSRPEARALIEEFRWMIEEFKVSIFAQELGTAFPISTKRLDQQLERIQN